ncbi:hypothetical protein [Streptomyces sp. WAC08401]|uniref:hypothetical protein n=1 Tax=Streptomyces sp. WAC08401 TaxID=2487413 RepID=UPI000FA24269|nr:hypothetical protein [Streptomyces sp. WAC08401]RSS18995.1 hypothetical protein EF915_00970 [Streptomyces sp. WAC08401]
MSRRPVVPPFRLVASALAAAALLTTAACSDDGAATTAADTAADQARAAERDIAEQAPTGSPTGSATASPSALTESGAKAALLTETDLEGGWNQVRDAGKWRDSMLIGQVDVAQFLTGKADASDCQELVDGLYGEDLLGKPSGASALTGFQQGDSRLLEQVAAYDRAALDDRLKWMASLPQKCDQFTLDGSGGGERTVQVTEVSAPEVGDARQGLHVTVRGDADGGPATLSLMVTAVRVGDSAVTVTGGGLDGDQKDSVEQATQAGAERLRTVLDGGTPSPQPTDLD